jgi:hypothetical protein
MNIPVTTDERTYWQRLKDHPGVPYVIGWAVLGFLIAGRDDWRKGILAAGLFLILFGPVVLWTARR